MFNKLIITLLFVFFFSVPATVLALSSEVSITKDGKAVVSGIKVMQLAGQTLFARLYWGDAFVRLTIKTNGSTKFFRAMGESTNLSEIAVNDILNVEGELESGGNTLVVVTKNVTNVSIEKERVIMSGKVIGVNFVNNNFTIETKDKKFDPHFHEALMQVENRDLPEHTVVEELQKGYLLNDRIIRTSKVKVSKK